MDQGRRRSLIFKVAGVLNLLMMVHSLELGERGMAHFNFGCAALCFLGVWVQSKNN
jgi:hypothetical protein